MIRSLLAVIYLIVGVVVAHNHQYLTNLHSASQIISAILAVLLWPVVLLGGNLHLGHLPRVKIKTKH